MNPNLTIRYFGILSEISGRKSEEIGYLKQLSEVDQALRNQYPRLAEKNYAFSVNRILIRGEKELNPGDEIALLPPFTGG